MGKAKKNKFKKFGPPPTLLAVGPKGEIEALPWSKNNNSPVEMRKGKLVLAAWMRDRGWISLAQAFRQDSREPVQMGGMRAYKDWLAARRADRALKFEGATLKDGSHRKKFQPYPEHLLPEEAIMRRQGRGSNAIESYVPGIPGLEMDPAEALKAMPESVRNPKPADDADEVTEIKIDQAPAADAQPKQGRRRRAAPAGDAPDGGASGE